MKPSARPLSSPSLVALVYRNNHQIDHIKTEVKTRGVKVPLVVDLVRALEYL